MFLASCLYLLEVVSIASCLQFSRDIQHHVADRSNSSKQTNKQTNKQKQRHLELYLFVCNYLGQSVPLFQLSLQDTDSVDRSSPTCTVVMPKRTSSRAKTADPAHAHAPPQRVQKPKAKGKTAKAMQNQQFVTMPSDLCKQDCAASQTRSRNLTPMQDRRDDKKVMKVRVHGAGRQRYCLTPSRCRLPPVTAATAPCQHFWLLGAASSRSAARAKRIESSTVRTRMLAKCTKLHLLHARGQLNPSTRGGAGPNHILLN